VKTVHSGSDPSDLLIKNCVNSSADVTKIKWRLALSIKHLKNKNKINFWNINTKLHWRYFEMSHLETKNSRMNCKNISKLLKRDSVGVVSKSWNGRKKILCWFWSPFRQKNYSGGAPAETYRTSVYEQMTLFHCNARFQTRTALG
jgi:hypothetical protein